MDTIVSLAEVVVALTSLLYIPMAIIGLTLGLKSAQKAKAFDQHLENCAREQNGSQECIGWLCEGANVPGVMSTAGMPPTENMGTILSRMP